MKKKICVVVGTRPEIIKMSPIIKELVKKNLPFYFVHTNQHYDENMDKIFFKELMLPLPKYNLNIHSGTHAEVLGKALIKLEKVFLKEKPSIVLAIGDTNSVLAAAITSVKLHIPFGHVESGLRSFDRSMPEEINRIMVDHISDYLFVPSLVSETNLKVEGIQIDKIFNIGNTVVDAVNWSIKLAEKKSKILKKLKLKNKKFCLFTLHRESNTSDAKKIKNVFSALKQIHTKYKLDIICPLHPRTSKIIKEYKIKKPKEIRFIEPIGYFDSLLLIKNAYVTITDSGGIQEESYLLCTPCITLRENTERPETIEVGANQLTGTDTKKILKAFNNVKSKKWNEYYGQGDTAKKILDIIK